MRILVQAHWFQMGVQTLVSPTLGMLKSCGVCEKPMIKKTSYSRTFAINEQLKSSPNGPCIRHWFYRITFLEHPSSYDWWSQFLEPLRPTWTVGANLDPISWPLLFVSPCYWTHPDSSWANGRCSKSRCHSITQCHSVSRFPFSTGVTRWKETTRAANGTLTPVLGVGSLEVCWGPSCALQDGKLATLEGNCNIWLCHWFHLQHVRSHTMPVRSKQILTTTPLQCPSYFRFQTSQLVSGLQATCATTSLHVLESTLCFFRHSLGRSLVCACHKDVLVNLLQRRHRSNKKRRNKQDNVLYLDKIETAKSTTFQLQCAISRWEGVRLGTTKSTPLGITSTLTCWGREP